MEQISQDDCSLGSSKKIVKIGVLRTRTMWDIFTNRSSHQKLTARHEHCDTKNVSAEVDLNLFFVVKWLSSFVVHDILNVDVVDFCSEMCIMLLLP